ncbi:unnamed protein product, partial [Ixodes hexagonus]
SFCAAADGARQERRGPTFSSTPPSRVEFLNSTETAIPCEAQGSPAPEIWWARVGAPGPMPDIPGLRHVRQDGALVFSPFRAEDFRQDIHAAVYRCGARNAVGAIVSGDVHVRAVSRVATSSHFVLRRFFLYCFVEGVREHLPARARRCIRVTAASRFPLFHLCPFLETIVFTRFVLFPKIEVDERGIGHRGSSSEMRHRQAGASKPKNVSRANTSALPLSVNQHFDVQVYDEFVIKGNTGVLRCQIPSFVKEYVTVTSWIRDDGFVVHADSDSGGRYTVFPSGELHVRKVDTAVDGHRKYYCQAKHRLTGKVYRSSTVARLIIIGEWAPCGDRVPDSTIFAHITICLRCRMFARQYVRATAWSHDSTFTRRPENTFSITHEYLAFSGERKTGGIRCKKPHAPNIINSSIKTTIVQLLSPSREPRSPGQCTYTEVNTAANPTDRPYKCAAYVSSRDTERTCARRRTYGSAPRALLKRWRRQKLNCKLELRIVKLTAEAAEYAEELTRSNWGQTCSMMQGTLTPLSATVRPRRTVAVEGSSATFNCSTSGHPVSAVLWLKNGQAVSSRVKMLTRETLHIASVLRDDKGMYQCFALNDYDAAQATAELTLGDDPPVLTFRFTEQTAEPGSPVSLKCAATGTPLPQITWSLDGSPVLENLRLRIGDFVTNDGFVNSFVNITSATTEDGGRYECHVTNDVETVVHGARLNVRGPPFVRAMSNVSVLAGATLVVSCPAAGHPISQILWYKGDAKLPQSKRQNVFPNGTLTVHKVERSGDEGSYRCVASGPRGDTASGELFVNVLVAPVVGPFSFPANLREGMRAIVTCSVLEGDSPVRIRWLKDRGPLAPNGADVKVESSNEFSSTLFIKQVNYKNRGEYTCVASNSAASANYTANMVVNVPPRWKVAPKEKSSVVGENVVVDCQAEGFPPPRIWWEKSSGSRPSEYKVIISNSHIHALENGSLMVREAERNDTGFYLCQASNGVGSGISKVIELKVHVSAHFKNAFNSKTLRKGDTAHIKCEVVGEKPLTIAWSKNGQPFSSTIDQRYDIKSTETEESMLSQLEIHAVDRRDSALFACLGTNKYGQDETRTQLIVQEPPGAPFNVRTSGITSRSMSVSWDQPYTGNSPISAYKVQLKTSGGESFKWKDDIQENVVQGTLTTLALRGLRPVTTYIVRIRAENSLGPGEFSQEIQVTTDEEAPEGPPLNVQATAVSSSSVKVTWLAPKREHQNGLLKGYYVGYRQHGSSESYTYKTLEIGGNFKEEALLTSLARSTKYTVLVQAFNDKGSGPPSEEVSLETFESDPPPAPSLSVFTTSSSSVQLQWDPKTKDSTPILGYYVYIKEQFGTWEEHQISAHQTTHTFQNLLCGTGYLFYVASYNKMGKGEPSEVISAKTQGSAPVAPKRDALVSVNGSRLSVHLSSWSSAGCPITSFLVQYRLHDESDWVLVSNAVLPDQKVLLVDDLVPGKWYILHVMARSEAGSTEQEFTFSTLTRTGAAIPPLNSLEGRKPAFYRSMSIMAPVVCVVAILVLIVATTSFVVSRRRRQATPNHFRDSCSEDKNLEAMSLSILKQTGSSLESASPSKEQIYYPSPYALGGREPVPHRQGPSESDTVQTLKRNRREHIYEVPYPRWSEEEETYSHITGNAVSPATNIYQTPRKSALGPKVNSSPNTPLDGRRLSREGRGHRAGYRSSTLASDGHSADDSDSEEAAYAFQRNGNGSYGEHQEMSEAECDRDQHTRAAKRLEALGIHMSPGYSIT